MSDTTPLLPGQHPANPNAVLQASEVVASIKVIKAPKRKPRGKNDPAVAMREHVVVIRRVSQTEIDANPINIGKENIVHISSRTGTNVFDLSSEDVIAYKRFAAGPGAKQHAADFRNAAVTVYVFGGCWRFTEADSDPTVSRQSYSDRPVRHQSVQDVRKKIELVLQVAQELPGTAEFKQRSLDTMMSRSFKPRSRAGVITQDDHLYKRYVEVSTEIQTKPEKTGKELTTWIAPDEHDESDGVVGEGLKKNKARQFLAQQEAISELQGEDLDAALHKHPDRVNVKTVGFTATTHESVYKPEQIADLLLPAPCAYEAARQAPCEPAMASAATASICAVVNADIESSVSRNFPKATLKTMPSLDVSFEHKSQSTETTSIDMSMAVTGLTPVKKHSSIDNWIVTTSYKDHMESLPRLLDPEADLRKQLDDTRSAFVWLKALETKLVKMLQSED